MQPTEIVLQILVTLIIGGIGAYFSYNYRIQTRLKVLELRIEAYRELFAVTEIASPTRLGRGAQLSEQDAKKLGKDIYSWYYENGHGLLMPNRTRQHLQWLQRTLQGEPVEEVPADPLLREVSKLRTCSGGTWASLVRANPAGNRLGTRSRPPSDGLLDAERTRGSHTRCTSYHLAWPGSGPRRSAVGYSLNARPRSSSGLTRTHQSASASCRPPTPRPSRTACILTLPAAPPIMIRRSAASLHSVGIESRSC